MIIHSLTHILRQTTSRYTLIISTLWMIYIWYIYSDIQYVAANYQSTLFAYFDTFLSWSMIGIFPIFLSSIVYKSILFGRKNSITHSGLAGLFSGIIWVCITGASCCGITLISVLGLSSIIGFLEIFPYHGLEIKTAWIIILLYATYTSLKNLNSCKRK